MSDESTQRRNLEWVGDLVDDVVAGVARRAGLGRGAVLMTDWANIAGPEWEEATPLRIETGTLHVRVANGMAATRLRHATGPLIERIGRRVGPDLVSSVRVHVRWPRTGR